MSTPNGAPHDPAPQHVPPHQETQFPPQPQTPAGGLSEQPDPERMSKVLRGALWIAIGALIAAAVVCVVWVLIGPQGNELVGRAFLTIVLLAGFSGCVLMEAGMADRRPSWLVLASMIGWVLVLLVGAVKIWTPFPVIEGAYTDFNVVERIWHLILAIGLVQLAVWTQHFLWKSHQRHVTTFTRAIAITTTVLTAALVLLLLFYLAFTDTFEFHELYWRIVVALAILVVVGTLMIPLLNALFAPKRPRPVGPTQPPAGPGGPQPVQQQWPTYVDGRTPLPVLPDGSPDWNAFYTGVPTGYQAPPEYAPPREAPAPAYPPVPPRPPLPPYPGEPGQRPPR
ncbi:hypothetical protein [Microbacterium rhizophilus]|uniref:hypothetical protein n=1 Tax=Microbacterium rhizophilus TaxID=3138934 RepID=UPI0031EC6783